jgi:hypothetical protein
MEVTYTKVNVMYEVCPDPDHILDPGISSNLTWGLMGFPSTDFFSATYSPIDFKLCMYFPYGEISGF